MRTAIFGLAAEDHATELMAEAPDLSGICGGAEALSQFDELPLLALLGRVPAGTPARLEFKLTRP